MPDQEAIDALAEAMRSADRGTYRLGIPQGEEWRMLASFAYGQLHSRGFDIVRKE